MMNKRKTPRELELISLRRQLTNKEKQLLFIQERKDDELSSLQRQLDEARVNLRLIQERRAEYVLGTEIPLQLVKEGQRLPCRIAELEQQIAALRAGRSVTSLLERLQKDIEELERRIKELEHLQSQEEDMLSKVNISKAIYISILLSIIVIIGVLLIILPFASPKTAIVALLTYHGRYVTDANDKNDLKAETGELKDWEKFTLLCLDDGKVALETYHGWYVTALNDEGDRDWKLRAYTEELNDWEKYTLVDVETERQLPCSEVLGLLKQGSVVIALKTHHGRYVTAQNDEGDRDWKLRAYTEELNDWEKFTLVPCQP
jgi:hypothetical protein